jgi:hypothetical protein
LTKKLDVYSFGVVLLELLTGVRALHKMRDGHRRSLVDLVRIDPCFFFLTFASQKRWTPRCLLHF